MMRNAASLYWLSRACIAAIPTLSLWLTVHDAAAASNGAAARTRAQPPSGAATAPGVHRTCSNAGLKLPPGFCASIFADQIGHARHMVVDPRGVLYVNTWSGVYYPNSPPPSGGFLVALLDTTGNGKANVVRRFGETSESGAHGGTGIALYNSYLYAEIGDRIVRYRMPAKLAARQLVAPGRSPADADALGSIVPTGQEEVILSGLPLTGDHPMHPFAIDADGWLYVDVASATNACQRQNRMLESPGIDPCTELDTRGGIWRYSANQLNQKFSPAERYATGIRNADGIAIDSTGHGLYSTQHGRDQLGQNWPKLFTPEQGAYLPAEELLRVVRNGNYGWPYCYYDGVQQKLELAPEYGGNGRTVGRCAGMRAPVAAFPAHWAPNDLMLYYGTRFPDHYHGGAFIAFHGSWNRAPFPQQGYNVVFQPLAEPGAPCEIFADGFSGADKSPAAPHRPSGLAAAPDGGALYVSDDIGGRIWRITYRGGSSSGGGSGVTPCPSMTALGAEGGSANALPPEGVHPNAGAVANLQPPPGATRSMLELGDRIYHGQVASATCLGCHGPDGRGTPLGPSLTSNKWLWGDGSYASIEKVIRDGVAKPKAYRSPMPPMGGSQLSSGQVSAVAAYVWALSHQGSGTAQ
jgi:glucose/arabinose dehydrogenase/mono/diheme cytochrome c family protein